jgi:predicted outer membrane protein
MTRIAFLPAAAALLALAACQSPTATPAPGANSADAGFITDAYQIIEFDRQEGAIAQTQARDPRVKAIAARLVDEANQYATQLAPIAMAAGVRPPDVLRYDLRVRLGHMRLQPGIGFDRAYLDDQIASHEEVLRNEDMMNPQEYSPNLMGLAERGKDLIRHNLADLQALRQSMAGASS